MRTRDTDKEQVKKLQTQQDINREHRKTVKQIYRQKKRTETENKAMKMEDYYKKEKIRHLYREVKRGKMRYDNRIRESWREYFNEMFSNDSEEQEGIYEDITDND